MSEQIQAKAISRRQALSLFGLVAALSVAVPSTALIVSEAEAQQPTAQPARPAQPEVQPSPGTGTERRQSRRTRRAKRRAARRKGRAERRELRRSGPKT